MAEQAKPASSSKGANGFRPGALVIALGLCIALLGLFDLLTSAHI